MFVVLHEFIRKRQAVYRSVLCCFSLESHTGRHDLRIPLVGYVDSSKVSYLFVFSLLKSISQQKYKNISFVNMHSVMVICYSSINF